MCSLRLQKSNLGQYANAQLFKKTGLFHKIKKKYLNIYAYVSLSMSPSASILINTISLQLT